MAEKPLPDLQRLNKWIEQHLGPPPANREAPFLSWMHGSPHEGTFQVYPFRPLFGDLFDKPIDRPVQWLHRSERDSVETSLWPLYSLLNSRDEPTRREIETWLTHGYLLFLWGTKLQCEGPDAIFPYPQGEIRQRMQLLTNVMDLRLRERFNSTQDKSDILKRVAAMEHWLEPPVGWPIEDVRSYFDQEESGSFGLVQVEFVFPLSWHIRRNKGTAGDTVKHYEEDMDYYCNQLLGGLKSSEGASIEKVWMTDVYQHFLIGRLLVDGELPPWSSAEDRALILNEYKKWLSEMLAFCEQVNGQNK